LPPSCAQRECGARAIQADQADPAAAAAVVGEVAREFGRLDILVNNAAVAVLGPVDSPASAVR
jgi:3-oxoacyl-[acyl-carrier protein] reductase